MRRKLLLLFFIAVGVVLSIGNANATSYEKFCNPNAGEVAFWEKVNFEGKCNKFSAPVIGGSINNDLSKPALLYEWLLSLGGLV